MLDKKTLTDIQAYIDSHLHVVNEHITFNHIDLELEYSMQEESFSIEIDDFIETKRKPTLNQLLFQFIDQSNVSDAEIYKKAGIDRRLFSKIRSNVDYRPSKNTTIALALALQLNQSDTETLLSAAGYTLSDSNTFDLIIQYCLEKQIYNMHSVNEALNHFKQKALFGDI